MIEIRFKIDPVAKGRPRISRGHAYTPQKTKVFENAIKSMARHHMRLINKVDPLFGPLEVLISFNIKKPKSVRRALPEVKPDLDNLVKGVFDGCNGIFWKDDAQVCLMAASKNYVDGPGSIDLIIKEI